MLYENHIEINNDTVLILFEGQTFLDIDQTDQDNKKGFESVTLTIEELTEIFNHVKNFQEQ